MDELELTLLDLREDFLKYFTKQQQKSRIISLLSRIGRRAANLPLMNFIEKYFLEYQNLAARKIPLDSLNARNTLLQALKDSSHPCAIKNPSRSLLKALRKQHEVKTTPYVEFFVDLPYRVGYMTRPFLSGLDVLALNTNQFPELVSQDDLLPLSEQRNPSLALFPPKLFPNPIFAPAFRGSLLTCHKKQQQQLHEVLQIISATICVDDAYPILYEDDEYYTNDKNYAFVSFGPIYESILASLDMDPVDSSFKLLSWDFLFRYFCRIWYRKDVLDHVILFSHFCLLGFWYNFLSSCYRCTWFGSMMAKGFFLLLPRKRLPKDGGC